MKKLIALSVLAGFSLQAGVITAVSKGVDKAGHVAAHAITPPVVSKVAGPVFSGIDRSGHVVAHGIHSGVGKILHFIW